MKTIGLLGGTGWSSTIEYYRLINQLVNEKLGGYHSARIILKSIDYHDIVTQYGKATPLEIGILLKKEILDLLRLQPNLFLICCNTLHKYFDLIKDEISTNIPIMHAVELTKAHLKQRGYNDVLFLATKFTMEDDFFKGSLTREGIKVTIPTEEERHIIHKIHSEELMKEEITPESKLFFENLIKKHASLNAVVLACSELGLVVHEKNAALPLVDPVILQCHAAVRMALYQSPEI